MLLSASNGVDSIVQLITVLVIFVFVLAVTFLGFFRECFKRNKATKRKEDEQ